MKTYLLQNVHNYEFDSLLQVACLYVLTLVKHYIVQEWDTCNRQVHLF